MEEKKIIRRDLDFDPIDYHTREAAGNHIFIYAVLGRSSSTALQRIINSSNKACIWGEPHGTIETIISAIECLSARNNKPSTLGSLKAFEYSYQTNEHIYFYPNALNELSPTIRVLESAITAMLKPIRDKISRFGYKDIGVSDIRILDYLKTVYAGSSFVFCFRDPVHQWTSVSRTGWWNYSKALDVFLNEYVRVAEIYLTFADKYREFAFIENNDLRNRVKLQLLLRHLNISDWDEQLIDLNVGSAGSNDIAMHDQEKIMASEAFSNYRLMKKTSELFFKNDDAGVSSHASK